MVAPTSFTARGRCMLALRPADYRREEALHYICCTLELPNRQVEVIEDMPSSWLVLSSRTQPHTTTT
eukprot:6355309-Amphidinium_carterae.1